ncbi:MAG: tRNA uridine-5-carboxymethylaminomethyl(34) synthesis GTPase MnmE [Candidatus Latescibacterota bacterium]|nr:MAG: tRNA uridine-5-carboxymethylaminomethyl(34) synthesis GTPase MnmE [Candidatus Latescibacterota bacterium]
MSDTKDTIVALATPAGSGGLAIVRVSGTEALSIASRLFRGARLTASESHRAHHGWILDADGRDVDEVLALVLRAPRSYTGEDTVEISCHGSPHVVDEIVAATVQAGARLAEPGEFTRRAFLNGKLDLCQAEAVADLIAAHTRASHRAALEQLRGRLSDRLRDVRDALVALLADVEASIDFVEEGIEFFGRDVARRRGMEASEHIDALLATADEGVLLRSGIRVSLAGAPNVGKSSLFNRIVQSPRSIVTEHAGTTRDVVGETLRLGGILMALEDTAGLRDVGGDPIEEIGIERSRQSHRDADLVIHVIDATSFGASAGVGGNGRVVALNKVDLLVDEMRERVMESEDAARTFLAAGGIEVPDAAAVCAVSAATGAGVDALLDALVRAVQTSRLTLQQDALVAINQRHREALVRAQSALDQFACDVEHEEPPEILAADLRGAVVTLGEISGEAVTEEILDSIFSRFCIGK